MVNTLVWCSIVLNGQLVTIQGDLVSKTEMICENDKRNCIEAYRVQFSQTDVRNINRNLCYFVDPKTVGL